MGGLMDVIFYRLGLIFKLRTPVNSLFSSIPSNLDSTFISWTLPKWLNFLTISSLVVKLVPTQHISSLILVLIAAYEALRLIFPESSKSRPWKILKNLRKTSLINCATYIQLESAESQKCLHLWKSSLL